MIHLHCFVGDGETKSHLVFSIPGYFFYSEPLFFSATPLLVSFPFGILFSYLWRACSVTVQFISCPWNSWSGTEDTQ